MDVTHAGVILNTEKYRQCVEFYGEVLSLPILHKIDRPNEQLTCFDLGGVYLMVETGGKSHVGGKSIENCPTKFRFNVVDVERIAEDLRRKGVSIEVRNYDWGTTAEFADPDGNRCALRSDAGFGV